MRDGSLQQLIIVGVFIVFALLDVIGRFAKKSRDGTAEPDTRDYTRDDDDFEIFDLPPARPAERQPDARRPEPFAEPRVPQPMPTPRPVPTQRPSSVPQSVPRSAPTRPPVARAPAPRAAPVRVAPVRTPSPRLAAIGMSAIDRIDSSRVGHEAASQPLLNVHDARRAILAMTILGPCRAMEPHQDPNGSR